MPFKNVIKGFKDFRRNYFEINKDLYKDLVRNGQSPETLVIGCCDSRTDPAHVMGAKPGEIFVVRNVAAIVPPYKSDKQHHGTSAAIEFAVKGLKVKHIVVMGHKLCGGIQALANKETTQETYEFLTPWMEIGNEALHAVNEELKDASESVRLEALEQAVVLVSLKNLMTFPWIAEKVNTGTLKLHGWYFDIKTGDLLEYNATHDQFEKLKDAEKLLGT